jgi:hypothetical protein
MEDGEDDDLPGSHTKVDRVWEAVDHCFAYIPFSDWKTLWSFDNDLQNCFDFSFKLQSQAGFLLLVSEDSLGELRPCNSPVVDR